jgi:hypothetical protein
MAEFAILTVQHNHTIMLVELATREEVDDAHPNLEVTCRKATTHSLIQKRSRTRDEKERKMRTLAVDLLLQSLAKKRTSGEPKSCGH